MKKALLCIFIAFAVFSCVYVGASAYWAEEDYDYYYSDEYGQEGYDPEEYSDSFEVGKNLAIAFVVGLVISLIITGVMRSKMKSVRYERSARNYIKSGSMAVTRSRDMYLYSHTTRREKPRNDNKRN